MTMDLLPTVMELLAIKPPAETGPNALDGVSLVPLLLRGETLALRTLFWRTPTQTAVREGPWKLVNDALYHLEDDLGEARDLESAQPEVVRRLKSKLADWEKEVSRK